MIDTISHIILDACTDKERNNINSENKVAGKWWITWTRRRRRGGSCNGRDVSFYDDIVIIRSIIRNNCFEILCVYDERMYPNKRKLCFMFVRGL